MSSFNSKALFLFGLLKNKNIKIIKAIIIQNKINIIKRYILILFWFLILLLLSLSFPLPTSVYKPIIFLSKSYTNWYFFINNSPKTQNGSLFIVLLSKTIEKIYSSSFSMKSSLYVRLNSYSISLSVKLKFLKLSISKFLSQWIIVRFFPL